jgi:hypothetical protein
MCEKPKEEEPGTDEPGNAKPRSYYYDDAHGYEDFDPEIEETETDENDESA